MTPAEYTLAIELVRLAIRYSPQVAAAVGKAFQKNTTLDDVITALEKAGTMTYEDYEEEAKARAVAGVTT